MRIKPDWFLLGMIAAVRLAWLAPGPGAHGGWLHPELLTKLGVALIFFLNGLGLSFVALASGIARWRLHVVVQLSTFLAFPLLGLAALWTTRSLMSPELALGFFYLCALPSAISSSVAMTSVAKGNVAGALFNATLSSLIGIVLTPLWLSVALGSGVLASGGATAPPLLPVIIDLVEWLLMPLVLGHLLRPWLGAWAARNKPLIFAVDRTTILLLVYTSFCDSFRWGVWSDHGIGVIVTVIVGSLVTFVAVMSSIIAVSRWLHFPREDRIAAAFCGTKKTLASGIPMAQLLFAGNPALAMIVMPIMVYHPLQLAICGVLARRWAKDAA